ncbi:MAG: YqaA family protein [Bacteroidota bacterium]
MDSLIVIASLFLGSFLAATIIPFSSEVMFVAALESASVPAITLVIVAGIGNTLGGLTGYWLGSLGKWKWLEKYFRVSQQKVESFRGRAKKYGYWLALLCWTPFIGDLLCIVLGFFRLRLAPVTVLMFVGKIGRYAVLAWLIS